MIQEMIARNGSQFWFMVMMLFVFIIVYPIIEFLGICLMTFFYLYGLWYLVTTYWIKTLLLLLGAMACIAVMCWRTVLEDRRNAANGPRPPIV